jgi:hypothetical protein
MRLSKRSGLWVLSFMLSALTACQKDDGPLMLPAITDTGANTFGCEINKRIFRPKGKLLKRYDPLDISYDRTNNHVWFVLSAGNIETNQRLIFNISEIMLKDTLFNDYMSPDQPIGLSARYYDRAGAEYGTYNNCPGEFRISRFDMINGIVSGTFWYDAVNPAAHDTIHIRNGRFDVKL